MAKRKAQQTTQPAATASKSAKGSKAGSDGGGSKLVAALLDHMLLSQSYCEELGIDIFSGQKRSEEVFKWLACEQQGLLAVQHACTSMAAAERVDAVASLRHCWAHDPCSANCTK